MKTTAKLLVAALAVAGLAVTSGAQAQSRGSHGGGSWSGGHSGGGSWNGSHGGSWSHGGGGHYWGGYRGYYGGYWGPSFGVYLAAPWLIGGWGWPYYYDNYYYPGNTVIYRDVGPYPQSYPDQPGELIPSTQVPQGEGAPSQGPLYMNYCESAKAYFPKVTTCPEGWRLATPAR